MCLLTVILNNNEYYVHHKYKSYGSDVFGNLINIHTKKTPKQSFNKYNEIVVNLAGLFRFRDKILKKQFIYECFHGPIEDCDIMILNKNETDLRLSNLVCMS